MNLKSVALPFLEDVDFNQRSNCSYVWAREITVNEHRDDWCKELSHYFLLKGEGLKFTVYGANQDLDAVTIISIKATG